MTQASFGRKIITYLFIQERKYFSRELSLHRDSVSGDFYDNYLRMTENMYAFIYD